MEVARREEVVGLWLGQGKVSMQDSGLGLRPDVVVSLCGVV